MRELVKNEDGYIIRVTGEEVYRQNSEVAAWFTDIRLDPGDYACEVYDKGGFWERASTCIPGTVVANNHSTLFGGVAVSSGPSYRGDRQIAYVSMLTSRAEGK